MTFLNSRPRDCLGRLAAYASLACSSVRAPVRNVYPIKAFLLFDIVNHQVSQSLPVV